MLLPVIKNISNEDPATIRKSYELVLAYIASSIDKVSNTFWQYSIESFFAFKNCSLGLNLLKVYPIRYSYSEIIIRNIIDLTLKTNTANLEKVFDVLMIKFKSRANKLEDKAYENIFNILLKQISVDPNFIDRELITKVYFNILNEKLKLNNLVLEEFYAKLARLHLNNFYIIEAFLIKSNEFLSKSIIKRIIEEYEKV